MKGEDHTSNSYKHRNIDKTQVTIPTGLILAKIGAGSCFSIFTIQSYVKLLVDISLTVSVSKAKSFGMADSLSSTWTVPHGDAVCPTTAICFKLLIAFVLIGVWPAFWSLGATVAWPQERLEVLFYLELHYWHTVQGGEIDILEGVHDNVHNQVTWHTLPGCELVDTGNFTGSLVVGVLAALSSQWVTVIPDLLCTLT